MKLFYNLFHLMEIKLTNIRFRDISLKSLLISIYLNKMIAYFWGSNIFDNIKHCVAIGGATCGGGCGVDITGAIFNAFAAAGGISSPVPSANLNISCNLNIFKH